MPTGRIVAANAPRATAGWVPKRRCAMPIYEYQCDKCGHEFEREQRIVDPPVKSCPECRGRKVTKLISRSSFVLKGGGWYADGYGDSKKSEAKSDDSSSTTSESKSDSTKSESSDKASSKSDKKSDKGSAKSKKKKSGS